jgi:hypothetical protein
MSRTVKWVLAAAAVLVVAALLAWLLLAQAGVVERVELEQRDLVGY